MIVDLPSTTTTSISKRLVRLRNDVGAMTLGRVLTLVIVVDEADADDALAAANDASHQHPCRIVVLVQANPRGANRLDAQIWVGGEAGASEVVVMRLYGKLSDHGQRVVMPLLLPDSPVVAWWPTAAPEDVGASPIGSIAQRRVTDSATARKPQEELQRRARNYRPGDTDLAWTRLTLWRGLLAAALDQPPFEPVFEATVSGAADSPSTDLLAAWLAQRLKCPVNRTRGRRGTGLISVRLERRSGPVDLVRPDGAVATLAQSGHPIRRISLARRTTAQCLSDELRRLDPDEIYAEALTKGLPLLSADRSMTTSEAVAEGEAPSSKQARLASRRIAAANRRLGSNEMVDAPAVPERRDAPTVMKAAARKLDAKVKGTAGSGSVTSTTTAAASGRKQKASAEKPGAEKTTAKEPSVTESGAKKGAR